MFIFDLIGNLVIALLTAPLKILQAAPKLIAKTAIPIARVSKEVTGTDLYLENTAQNLLETLQRPRNLTPSPSAYHQGRAPGHDLLGRSGTSTLRSQTELAARGATGPRGLNGVASLTNLAPFLRAGSIVKRDGWDVVSAVPNEYSSSYNIRLRNNSKNIEKLMSIEAFQRYIQEILSRQ